ncbi:hypothetical protein E9228_002849 [Curtobacterium flaccumfaciens]|uniref:Uncharacterized protein n=1 Tax=Curtobacterium salicis TaxID=1779862 RepID=A0ABX0T9L4_9MICO|nr:hypothetical protein [Curtobacterium sp. WW7]
MSLTERADAMSTDTPETGNGPVGATDRPVRDPSQSDNPNIALTRLGGGFVP